MHIMKKEPFGITVGPADQCYWFKENELGMCITIIHINDILIIVKNEQIQEFATKIQK